MQLALQQRLASPQQAPPYSLQLQLQQLQQADLLVAEQQQLQQMETEAARQRSAAEEAQRRQQAAAAAETREKLAAAEEALRQYLAAEKQRLEAEKAEKAAQAAAEAAAEAERQRAAAEQRRLEAEKRRAEVEKRRAEAERAAQEVLARKQAQERAVETAYNALRKTAQGSASGSFHPSFMLNQFVHLEPQYASAFMQFVENALDSAAAGGGADVDRFHDDCLILGRFYASSRLQHALPDLTERQRQNACMSYRQLTWNTAVNWGEPAAFEALTGLYASAAAHLPPGDFRHLFLPESFYFLCVRDVGMLCSVLTSADNRKKFDMASLLVRKLQVAVDAEIAAAHGEDKNVAWALRPMLCGSASQVHLGQNGALFSALLHSAPCPLLHGMWLLASKCSVIYGDEPQRHFLAGTFNLRCVQDGVGPSAPLLAVIYLGRPREVVKEVLSWYRTIERRGDSIMIDGDGLLPLSPHSKPIDLSPMLVAVTSCAAWASRAPWWARC